MDAAVQDVKRDNMVARLRRVEGQLRGIQRMIQVREPCEDIARQMTAARRALDRAFYEMIACSMEQELGKSGDDVGGQYEAVAAVTRILSKYG
ncbi:MAG: hypothetical protein EPN72_07775 [Nevskiaceae bacterium]|nr:MAG: hypothetical protein EPN63_04835 [Nevskiaceae bacterium]TBR73057.1 MAG: hypothetical protein EPN72_07775 [Nevskiaceae bacterium]